MSDQPPTHEGGARHDYFGTFLSTLRKKLRPTFTCPSCEYEQHIDKVGTVVCECGATTVTYKPGDPRLAEHEEASVV